MAFAPLILKGNLKINGDAVPEQITSFAFKGARETINIPATFGARASVAGGADTYECEISYLQDTDATEALSMILWDALADDEGMITVAGTLRPGAIGANNPEWQATCLVTAAMLGGEVNTVGVDSVTLPCTDRPVKDVTP